MVYALCMRVIPMYINICTPTHCDKPFHTAAGLHSFNVQEHMQFVCDANIIRIIASIMMIYDDKLTHT